MELRGKTAVVTGGASGIGYAVCEALAKEGINAIGVVDRSAAVTDACVQLNDAIGQEVGLPFVGDVTEDKFRRQVFREMKSRHRVVHLCVPAAGITKDRLAVKLDQETAVADIYPRADFESVIEIDLVAPVFWALETVASVAEDRARRGLGRWEPDEGVQGCIVLIGSVSSAGNKGQISYAAAKSGLEGAQATLAKEAIFYGVRCAIIHPGYTETPMVTNMREDFIREKILPNTQLRRLLRPDEVAGAILFMLKNSAVSGSLWADGGWHPAA